MQPTKLFNLGKGDTSTSFVAPKCIKSDECENPFTWITFSATWRNIKQGLMDLLGPPTARPAKETAQSNPNEKLHTQTCRALRSIYIAQPRLARGAHFLSAFAIILLV